MGNNVDLKTIINAMQTYADTKGNNNDKVDTAEEIIIFENLAGKKYENGQIDDSQYVEIMGLYKNNGATTPVTNPNTEPQKVEPEKVSEYMTKGNKRDYFRVLENEAQAMTRTQLKAHMTEAYKSMANNENIIKFQKAFNEVLDVMPAKYETIKDIKNQHDSVVEKLEKAGLKDDIHLDILEQLEKAAKNEVTSNTKTAVTEDFRTRLGNLPPKANGKPDLTHEATINAMYNELEAEKQEAKNLNKDERKVAEAKIKEKEAAIDNLVRTQVLANAKRYVHEAITSVRYTSKDSEGAIQDLAIRYLEDNNMLDKYTANLMSRALVEKDVFAEKNPTEMKLKTKDSFGEALIEKQQKANRVRAKLVQSEAQIKDALGKNDSELFSALIRSGLVTKTEDGNYDLTALSLVLGNLVGQDFTRSATSKENREISEKIRTTGVMSEKTGFKNLTNVEAKELLELCGYDIEGVDLKKVIAGTAIGAAYSALAGFLTGAWAAATNPNQDVLVEGDTVINDLKVTINSDLFNSIDTGNLPDGFNVTDTETGVVISIYQLIKYPDVFIDISKHIPETAVKSALAGALSGAIAGALASLQPDGEAWITSTQFMETDLAKYAKQVQHMNPKYATSLIALAETFVKDGKWDVEAYKQYLNRYAGDGSPLNEAEFYSALNDRLKEMENKTPTTGTTPVNNNYYAIKDKDAVDAQYATVPTIDGTYTTWSKLVEQYDCLNDISFDKNTYPNCYKRRGELAIRILKVAQAITDGNYSKERLLDLAEKSFAAKTGRYEELKDYKGINHSVLVNTMEAKELGKDVRVPDTLAGCNRNSLIEIRQILDKSQWATTPKKAISRGDTKYKTKDGEAAVYYTRLNGEVKKYTNKKDRDDAVKAFKEKYPNAQCEKWE